MSARGTIRALVTASAVSGLLASGAGARTLDLADPQDAVTVSRKMGCSVKDNVPVVFHWTGRAYSRVPGEPDRHLFDVEGMNIRQCGTVTDPERGTGYRMVSRELMFYQDPETGAVLDRWTNPWSDETVKVYHVANDPVNMHPVYPVGAGGEPYAIPNAAVKGRWFSMPIEVPLFYRNPLGGAYQDYVGNKYHAMEIFDFSAEAETVLDGSTDTADAFVAWVRIADWLPWMKMGGRPGMMVLNATGRMLGGFSDLPPAMRERIEADYPAFTAPPPVDDRRPNETSWTYFKKQIDAESARPE
ncbi:DUF1838 domain-containing protein [Altererythrobacter marinus]|uniref:DUF1838 domain-containing protein n=1 Tax=Pelagerythrobacter marinus TaxID=538382 RepID=A0ABW9V0M9_9SPHN|nr:DUF1838 family protein [Pelagerythrobacter marinus]MXO69485.1 DUF1838 domain-containing protein [Pelagerythrobacter marinus]